MPYFSNQNKPLSFVFLVLAGLACFGSGDLEPDGKELIYVSDDNTSFYGKRLVAEELAFFERPSNSVSWIYLDGNGFEVVGDHIYIDELRLLKDGSLFVVDPEQWGKDVLGLSVDSFSDLVLKQQVLYTGEGSGNYFNYVEKNPFTRLIHPVHCNNPPHPTQAPHHIEANDGNEESSCHGGPGMIGTCNGKKGNVVWTINCTGALSNQRCTASISCADGQNGIDNTGESVDRANVWSNLAELYVGRATTGDVGYISPQSGIYAEVTLDCSR